MKKVQILDALQENSLSSFRSIDISQEEEAKKFEDEIEYIEGKVSYQMEYVPLKIGIMIRPDDRFYDDASVQRYSQAYSKITSMTIDYRPALPE